MIGRYTMHTGVARCTDGFGAGVESGCFREVVVGCAVGSEVMEYTARSG